MNKVQSVDNNNQFKQWVDSHSDELYRWALSKVSSKETAEDLVQETFMSAFHAIDQFNHESHPKTWLFAILNRKIIDHYRKASRTALDISNQLTLAVHDASNQLFNNEDGWTHWVVDIPWEENDELLDNRQFLKVLSECLGKLPEHWSVSLASKYLLEKDTKEICQELNITPSNYWQILHRAKLLMKSCLELNWFKR